MTHSITTAPTVEGTQPATLNTAYRRRRWLPEQVLFTPAALDEPWGQQILERVQALDLPVEYLKQNRLTGLRGDTERETYAIAKRTLAVVTAPASQLKLTPIPPSADWQFHLAQGCPAHCQYCYLAGSLQGPPVIRAYANLPQILDNLKHYEHPDRPTTYEVSCYTDPLGIEHLTGSLAECIRYFGTRDRAHLRWVSKFDQVDDLLALPHHGRTRCRFSINAASVSRLLEGGTASVAERLQAIRKLALPVEQGGGGYPVGLVIAPIMPIEHWQDEYGQLLEEAASALDFDCDLTFELISHRFTPGSKGVLEQWYPNSKLDLDESTRTTKRNKFGGTKYVYDRDTMTELRTFFEGAIARWFPQGKILYWT
ncbi:radical SAM protein [Leptolyngbya sp. SLC-A1]|uniref:spore photoproduct lyase family protein n=1 Tax=unclassified Phormidium TaxID=2609805 RepID=UPI0018F0323E|nr:MULTISPECIES: radical SAM protein [Cyanophyceae]